MGMFEQFPFTNFHELNLDWLIQEIKKLGDAAVLSVNGETGDVILYQDALVRLPDITDTDTWNFFRFVNGQAEGIQFRQRLPAERISGTNRYALYDAGNPPPYPVTAVNGETGNVVIQIPVQSVNGQTGVITLYQQANIEFPALESGDAWSMWRETENNAEVGIKFTSGQPIKRLDDGDEYTVYDSGNQPPYPVESVAGLTGAVAILDTNIITDQGVQKIKIAFPVTSVDGQTGAVSTWAYSSAQTLKTPVASEGDRWALARECPSGDIGIRFTYDSTNGVQGYLVFSDGQNPETALRILTPADIPQSAVVSVNGQSGIVVLRAEDIQMSTTDNTTVAANIADRAKLQDIAIVITGNTASVNVTTGQFVYVKGSTITGIADGLYKAVNNVAAGTPFTSADLDNTDTANGGLNAISSIHSEWTLLQTFSNVPSANIPTIDISAYAEIEITGYYPAGEYSGGNIFNTSSLPTSLYNVDIPITGQSDYAIKCKISKTQITNLQFVWGGNDVTSGATISIYYK